jgi:pimeloyl-ACP methyl ester carboxylesterase
MPILQANETDLEYIERGHGDPVIFVHGSLGDLRSWSLQMEQFSRQYRAIAYSRRYHYPRAESVDRLDYSVDLHAKDLASFIEGLGIQNAHIVASSYGAYTALVLATMHPGLVRSLTIGEPPILPWLEWIEGGSALMADFMMNVWNPLRVAFQRGDMEEGVRIFINGVLGEGTFDKMPTEARAAAMDNAQELKDETMSPGLFSSFSCEDAREIKVPTLLLTGELSPAIFRFIIEELQRCIPDAECQMIPKTSHAVYSGNPETFNAKVLSFLSLH